MENQREEILKKIMVCKDELEDVDEEMIHELLHQTVTTDTNQVNDKKATFGEIMSDKISGFVGSWIFILTAIAGIFIWMALNALMKKSFDPYPFILLNLVLSCVAAIQGPIIMMSQNRQEDKDRIRAKNDYKVNVKSEIIVEDLHNKMDFIIEEQESIKQNQNNIMEALKILMKDKTVEN